MWGFALQNQPYVKVGIEQIAASLGRDTGDKTELSGAINVANDNNVIRKPLTESELAILRNWFDGWTAQYLIEELSR